MATARLHATDLAAARRWYTELLGLEPYFVRPEYVEFRIGDYQQELGLLDARYAPQPAAACGAVVYWHVDDVETAVSRLRQLGATELEAVRDFGSGFVGAAVADPFGNILGVMQNPHYLEVLHAPR